MTVNMSIEYHMLGLKTKVGLEHPQRHIDQFYVGQCQWISVELSNTSDYTDNTILSLNHFEALCTLAQITDFSFLSLYVPAHAEPGQGRPDDGRYLRGAPVQLQPAAGQRQQASQGHQQLHQMRQRYVGRHTGQQPTSRLPKRA